MSASNEKPSSHDQISQTPATQPTAATPSMAVQSTPPAEAQAPHCSMLDCTRGGGRRSVQVASRERKAREAYRDVDALEALSALNSASGVRRRAEVAAGDVGTAGASTLRRANLDEADGALNRGSDTVGASGAERAALEAVVAAVRVHGAVDATAETVLADTVEETAVGCGARGGGMSVKQSGELESKASTYCWRSTGCRSGWRRSRCRSTKPGSRHSGSTSRHHRRCWRQSRQGGCRRWCRRGSPRSWRCHHRTTGQSHQCCTQKKTRGQHRDRESDRGNKSYQTPFVQTPLSQFESDEHEAPAIPQK